MNLAFIHPHLKMLASPRNSHFLKLAVIALSLFFTAYYLFSGGSKSANLDYKDLYKTALSGKKKVFVEKFLANEIDGPFDNSTITELCKTRTRIPGLIFSCESPDGGVGNVRNAVLNCVRYAIEAGATGFVIPEILIQLKAQTTTPVPFTHFFDTAYFTQTLSTSCPQMQIYQHINDLYDVPSTAKAIHLVPSSLTKSFIADTVIGTPGEWRANFQTFLNSSHPTPFTEAKPVHVKLTKPLLQFPLSYDPPLFVSTFGRMLRFRLDTRTLAAAILYALSTQHNLGLTPQIQNKKFYGAHLRTGTDAKAAGWTPYEVQAANYLDSAEHLGLKLIYLVSGNPDDIVQFSSKAANGSIAVTNKELLLGGPTGSGVKGFEMEWAQLKVLSWDQRLLVDYEVLLRSSAFGGTWESSLSWNLAMRRHVVVSAGAWKGLEGPGESVEEKSISAHVAQPPPAGKKRQNIEKSNRKRGGDEDEVTEVKDQGKRPETAYMIPFQSEDWRFGDDKRRRSRIEGRSRAHQEAELVIPGGVSVEKREEGEKLHAPATITPEAPVIPSAKVGDTSFRDGLTVIFGPVGEGRRILISMWP